MDSDHWQLIQKLFHDVTDLPEEDWVSYLENQPKLAPEVRDEVIKLLGAEQNSTSDIEQVQENISGLLTEINLPVIDDYEVSEQIAVGGMGSVYKAWDSRLSRHVAIKFLHPHRSRQLKAKQRFLREARSSAKIRHENICPIFEVSETQDEILYIVSAFCEGVDLSKKIRSNALNLKQILSIFEQLLSALSTAHAQGIVHRDLKPENIIVDDSVTDNCKIQLIDFGIARSITSDSDDYQTGTGEILGTPDYMSPEQFRGEAFDHLSDIWSCGIIFYEMLEGKTPYKGKTAPEIIYSMLHESIPFSAEEDQGFTPLYAIIRKCLQTDKSLRPTSVDSLLVMLVNARSELLEKDYLKSKPTYEKSTKVSNDEPQNSLSTQRKIVSLKLKIPGQAIDKKVINSLESNCLKYRGLISEKKYSKRNQAFQIRAFFGYPIADELTIKNAINCGLGWESILSEAGLEYFMLAGFEKVIEKEKTFATDPTLQGEEWMTDIFIGQIHKPGFWVMNQLSKGMRDELVDIQDSLQLSTNDTEDICHLIKPVVSHEESSAKLNLSHFIGRDSQLFFLLENWEQAVEGEQQRILISGEAGIGKSRLIYEFKKRVEAYPDLNLVELDCSPYEKVSTYYPILQFLRRRIGKEESRRKEGALNYLEKLFEKRLEKSSDTDKTLFCKLMGIELDLEEQANLPTGDLLSRRYQDLLIRVLTAKAEGQTSLLIIEDLHWADAATGVIIEKLLQPSSISQSMILMSSRPEYKPVWLSNIVTSNLYLSKLRQSQSETLLKDLVKDLSAGKDVSSANKLLDMVPQLVERTGGNPLFIEEIDKTFDAFSGTTASSQLTIPETIQDTLIARLERLGVAQYMAQLASVIGRDFNLELLKRCQNESEAEFKQQLHTLIQADIFHSLDNENNYRFKHALIRDAAYQMLVPESRKELHKVIATTLEKEFPESVNSQPELLAQHWEASESIPFAVKYWLLAAQRNLQLSSITECMDQCDHVIQLCGSNPIPDSKHDIDQSQLLMAYMIKGPALMFRRGYADERMREAYSKALELIEKTNNKELEFPALFGLWTYHCVKAQHESAAQLAQKMVVLSVNLSPFEKCEAHMVTGITQYYRGQFEPAQKELSIAFENYDAQQAQQHILTFGQDPGVVIQSYQAWNESMLGNMLEATTFSTLAVENARKLKHPFTLTYALSFSGWFKLNSGQIEGADLLINESIDVCEKNEIAVFLGLSLSLKALVLFSKGEVEEGTAVMEKAEKIYLGTGATLFVPGFMTIKAEVSLVLQDIETAEQLLDQALEIIDKSDENWSLALTLALRSVVYASRGQEEKEEALLLEASKVLTEQNALGLRKLMEEERGFDLD